MSDNNGDVIIIIIADADISIKKAKSTGTCAADEKKV